MDDGVLGSIFPYIREGEGWGLAGWQLCWREYKRCQQHQANRKRMKQTEAAVIEKQYLN